MGDTPMVVTLGSIITAAQSQDSLGISDRDTIIDYIQRAIELAAYKAHWDPYLGTMDICSDGCGYVTLPNEVGVILACNVGGFPAQFRNSWFQYHINGPGSLRSGSGNAVGGSEIGGACEYFWDDEGYTPCFQQIKNWSYLNAFTEDPIDGNGSLSLQVFGETMDSGYNVKQALTIPVSGPSSPGVFVPLLAGYAATDPAATQFRKITRVIKPTTRGYIKLIAFQGINGGNGTTIGYYAPNETNPYYKRIRVNSSCKWVRIKYRRKEIQLVNDTDIIPLPSKTAMLCLLKAVRMIETNNISDAQLFEDKAVSILQDIQEVLDGPAFFQLQIQPGFGTGCYDYR
jgi:hypothetical protein